MFDYNKNRIIRVLEPHRDKNSYVEYLKRPDCGGRNYEWYNEDWLLTKDGNMVNAIADYEILSDKLSFNLFNSLFSKKWFDANTFLPAFFEACRRANIKQITINIDYE